MNIDTEYSEINNNFRFFVALEKDYLQIFVSATPLLVAAFWFVSESAVLRYFIYLVGAFLSLGSLIAELRYAAYFKYFFRAAIDLEKGTPCNQFSNIDRFFSRPFLGLRSTNIIISFYFVFLFIWVLVAVFDLLGVSWFVNGLTEISRLRSSRQ